jgi:hypothetical protein
MYAVEVYAAVRQFVFVEGKSRREAARVFGLNRETISKICRFSVPPGYVRQKPAEKPKLGPLTPVIDAIFAADVTAPPKQRHTAQRIFERLKAEHGYTGGPEREKPLCEGAFLFLAPSAAGWFLLRQAGWKLLRH